MSEDTKQKHVMISYQWDSQALVKQIDRALKEKGLNIWIDYCDMKGDINDAMAEAIEGAAVIVPVMTQAYQDSHNCKKELSLADAHRLPIVPIMAQKGFTMSGWLSVIVAGKLYTAFPEDVSAETEFDRAVEEVHKNIQNALNGKTSSSSLPSNLKQPQTQHNDVDDDDEPAFTVAIMGDGGTGKSCIINRQVGNSFPDAYDATIFDKYRGQQDLICADALKLQYFDTAGQDEFKALWDDWIRESDGIAMVFSVDGQASFEVIEDVLFPLIQSVWDVTDLEELSMRLALVANKVDLPKSEREVKRKDAEAWCKEHGNIPYFEVSAKSNEGIESAFRVLSNRAGIWKKGILVSQLIKSGQKVDKAGIQALLAKNGIMNVPEKYLVVQQEDSKPAGCACVLM